MAGPSILARLVIGCALALVLGRTALHGQDWRESFVTSFDVVWQTVAETYYDAGFGGLDWGAVRTELRPRMTLAETPASARAVMRDMVGRLGQSHFTVITADQEDDSLRGPATVPIDVRVDGADVIVTAVVGESSASRAGLRVGDRVRAIDGRVITSVGLSSTASGAARRAEERRAWQRAMRDLSGDPGSTARIAWVRPDGSIEEAEVSRVVGDGDVVSFGHLPPFRARVRVEDARTPAGRVVGVIGFNVWMPIVAQPFDSAIDRFRGADGLVIDLRGNPGGLADMIRGIAGHVVAEPLLLGRMRMRAAELEFRANPRRATVDGRRVEPYAGPVAVLVDGLTGSASECFAGGLQSLGRVRVFGTTTMGQALPAATRSLPNGDVFMYAVGDFVTSTGRRLEGEGVVPDEVVPLDPGALAAGRDAEWHALRWIDRVAAAR